MIEELKHEKEFRKETGISGIVAYSKYLEEYFAWLEKKYSELKAIQVQAVVKPANGGLTEEEFIKTFTGKIVKKEKGSWGTIHYRFIWAEGNYRLDPETFDGEVEALKYLYNKSRLSV